MVTAEIAGKVRADPNWRMWTVLAAVLTVALAFVSWSHANMIEHIDLKLKPITILVAENTHARKLGGRYTERMSIDDKAAHRIEHNINSAYQARIQKQIDHLNDMIVGEDRFSKEGAKMDQRIIRLEERVFK